MITVDQSRAMRDLRSFSDFDFLIADDNGSAADKASITELELRIRSDVDRHVLRKHDVPTDGHAAPRGDVDKRPFAREKPGSHRSSPPPDQRGPVARVPKISHSLPSKSYRFPNA